MRVLAEIIASAVSLLVTFNQAIDGVIQNNQKARQNPKALAQLDGYKRPLVGWLSANLQRFGMEKVGKLESLQEIIAEMTDTAGTSEKTSPDCPLQRSNGENDGIAAASSDSISTACVSVSPRGAQPSLHYAMLIV